MRYSEKNLMKVYSSADADADGNLSEAAIATRQFDLVRC